VTDIKEVIKQEYKKCAARCDYFLSRYSYIQHPIRGKTLFDLYQYQKDTIGELEDFDYNIILKGRQIGISTLIAGYSLWLMLFHNDKNILVIATKQEVAKNLVTKVRYMHLNLPVWLRGNCTEDNKLSMRFSNGSQIKAVASSPDAGRSEALSLLILDECVGEDTKITIRNKITGEIQNISIGEFYKSL
jgi:phage terminase large subunit-like protein